MAGVVRQCKSKDWQPKVCTIINHYFLCLIFFFKKEEKTHQAGCVVPRHVPVQFMQEHLHDNGVVRHKRKIDLFLALFEEY